MVRIFGQHGADEVGQQRRQVLPRGDRREVAEFELAIHDRLVVEVAHWGPAQSQGHQQNAERILLQSVAASTMSAHLAAAALGYQVWWVTAIGQEDAQTSLRPLIGVPDDLAIIDIMAFGVPAKPAYKRWKKTLPQIVNWDRFDMKNYMSVEDIEAWVRETRHKVMYRDEAKVD